MFLKQYYLGCLAHASYLIADEASKTAIVVDPQRDIEQYLIDAERMGAAIRYVFLTHFHADFLAGHLELRDRCGAEIRLGAQAKADYKFVPMKDGDTLDFPGLRLQVLETPGIRSSRCRFWSSIWAKMRASRTRCLPGTRFLSAMWGGQICGLRWGGRLRS